MEIDFLIKALKEQKEKINQTDLEVWLNTTYSYIQEYFPFSSSRNSSFFNLIHDFKITRNYSTSGFDFKSIKERAISYINEIIRFLEEKKLQEESKELQSNLQSNNNRPNILPIAPLEEKIITRLPLGISLGLFWTIIVALVSGSFVLGNYFGVTKFDREKIDFYDQIKILKNEEEQNVNLIRLKDSLIEQKDSILYRKNDSIKTLTNDLNSLYFHIGTIKNK